MNDQHNPSIIDLGLFTGSPQHQNFCRVQDLMPTREMTAARTLAPWPVGQELQFPNKYAFDGAIHGYQWWIPDGDRSEFAAIGVYNQFVYVDPHSAVTIVKLSANHRYGMTSDEATNRENETLAVLRTIAQEANPS